MPEDKVITDSVSASNIYLRKLLLKCALSNGKTSVAAFEEWENLIVFDDLDAESFLLLPLVYLKLLEHEVEGGKFFLRIKSIYRRTWTENQILSKHLNQVFRLFEKSELPFVIASDELTLINLYDDFGAFSLQGFAIFAPFRDKTEFSRLMTENGWKMNFDENEKTEFRFDDFFSMEIYWKTRADFSHFRKRARRKKIFKTEFLTLKVEEQTINLCAGKFLPFRENDVRWQIVAGSLFKKRRIEEEKLISAARERDFSAETAEMLRNLTGDFGIEIPEKVIRALKRNQKNGRFNLLRQKIRNLRKDYANATEYGKHRFSFGGFTEFLSERWKVDSSVRLVIRAERTILKIWWTK